jgi:hypothetical protein
MSTYGAPKKVEIILTDDDGSERRVTATRRYSNTMEPQWDLRTQHPSGMNWSWSYSGHPVLDAAATALERKEPEYHASKGRGHKPHPMLPDRNIPINEAGDPTRATIMPRR